MQLSNHNGLDRRAKSDRGVVHDMALEQLIQPSSAAICFAVDVNASSIMLEGDCLEDGLAPSLLCSWVLQLVFFNQKGPSQRVKGKAR